MPFAPQLLLLGSVVAVGILHTIVPDHWVPITLMARQQGWSKKQTTKAALTAGTGHVISTLLIASVVWLAGVAFATKFGSLIDLVSSLALIAFGAWIAVASWLEMRAGYGHGHSHDFEYLAGSVHGPELQDIQTPDGHLQISIFEHDMPPHFRLTGIGDSFTIETIRKGDERQTFLMENKGEYWQSVESIPEPHEFSVAVTVVTAGTTNLYNVYFKEHSHDHGHDHPPVKSGKNNRTALLLILGSSPMIEGIPAFFAAGKYGLGLIIPMAVLFGISTIATYVLLSVYSAEGLEHVRFAAFEKYGEVLSGGFIALIGAVFLIFPVL